MISIKVDIQDVLNSIPRLGQFVARLKPKGHTDLNEHISGFALNVVHDWIAKLSLDNHATADRLGAQQSNFWEHANVERKWDASAATVTVFSPGIGRAAHDVQITPQDGHKYLTIPLIAEAYDNRASTIPGLFIPGSQEHKSHVLATRNPDGSLKVWYALVTSVMQHQDRTLMPPDEKVALAAVKGVNAYMDALLSGRQQ
jgi:hypothetical protein